MKLKPLGDRVLVKPAVPPTQTASGLLLAEHAKPEQVGTVIAIGDGATTTGVAVGDTVLFSWQSGQEVILDDEGTKVLIMLDEDLLSVVGKGIDVVAEELIL